MVRKPVIVVGFVAVVSCLGVLMCMDQWKWNPPFRHFVGAANLGSTMLRKHRVSSGETQKSRSKPVILERLLRSEENWRDAVKSRHNYISTKKNLESFKPWGDTGFTVIWNLFAATFECPNIRQRVGNIGDGGKWLCGFEVFEETKIPCVVYSFGVGGESSFEAEILQKTNCKIFAYGLTADSMGPEINKGQDSRVHFQKKGLGVTNNSNLKTLKTLMEENGHKWIDILKIDIEGDEFETLDNILKTFQPLPFGQMQIEVHLNYYNIPGFYMWFERLEAAGLRPFNSEVNFQPVVSASRMMPVLMEYSFLNVHVNHTLVPEEFVSELRRQNNPNGKILY